MSIPLQRVADRHSELFHYTSVDAFKSIYRSRQFWATHYAYMNDGSELSRFRIAVREFIAPIIRNILERYVCQRFPNAASNQIVEFESKLRHEIEMHPNILHSTTFGEQWYDKTFVCSFCSHDPSSVDLKSYSAEHGLLSQWRGYGAGGGVAIVLDTKKIEDSMEREAAEFSHPINHICDVIYDNDIALIRQEFHEVFDWLPEIYRRFYADEAPPYENIMKHFVYGSTSVKHHAFCEEAEVRIVVSPKTKKNSADISQKRYKRIRYRIKDHREIPYIELFGDAPFPINRVIIGPSRFQNFNCQQVKDVVSGSGIEVCKSATPFLG